jgi:hypothetical protein
LRHRRLFPAGGASAPQNGSARINERILPVTGADRQGDRFQL